MLRTIRWLIVLAFMGFFGWSCSEGYDLHSSSIPDPVAEAGPVQKVLLGSTIIVDGAESVGENLRYHWTVRSKPEGEFYSVENFENSQAEYTANDVGTYVFQLHVQNEAGRGSKDFVTVEVTTDPAGFIPEFGHVGIRENCQSCHNGQQATGRPANHISSTDNCITCHEVQRWVPAINVDHNEVVGTCNDCHNNIIVFGKSEIHIATELSCNECHVAGTSFKQGLEVPVSLSRHRRQVSVRVSDDDDDDDDSASGAVNVAFDHSAIGNAFCMDCHNAVIATGKPVDHIPAPDFCELCHSTVAWEPVNAVPVPPGTTPPPTSPPPTLPGGGFDHSTLGPGIACFSCHDGVIAAGKPSTHIPTTDACEACHGTSIWIPRMVDHNEVLGSCTSCHAIPAGHIPVTSECNLCHSTTAWLPVGGAPVPPGLPPAGSFDHSTLGPGVACASCHNGIGAQGKSVSHITSSDLCDVCHTTVAWVPAVTVDHNEVVGACFDCHNGVVASGKTAAHIETTNQCDACHSTVMWIPALLVDHEQLTGACFSCHNGTVAMGKPAGHIIATDICEACHGWVNWTPVITVDHNQALGTCSSCHDNVIATGKSATHVATTSECDVCHTTTSWF